MCGLCSHSGETMSGLCRSFGKRMQALRPCFLETLLRPAPSAHKTYLSASPLGLPRPAVAILPHFHGNVWKVICPFWGVICPRRRKRTLLRWGEEEQRSDCAFRPQGGNKGCGACDDEIPGVMFYSDLTNRCSTCSHWYSARILIRGGVLTHCFRLFVPTAGAVESFGVAPCMPNSGQFCVARTNGPFV